MSEALTRKQAAARAGVHINTVRLWERSGRVRTERVKVGSRTEVRISAEEIAQVISEREAEAAAQAEGKAARGSTATRARELERLRAEASGWRLRAEKAEAVAAERERSLTDLRLALRVLSGETPKSARNESPK